MTLEFADDNDLLSYYSLLFDTDWGREKPALSSQLNSFIMSMSKSMMDFYNRFPKGSPLPERRVNLPKRDPKSTTV